MATWYSDVFGAQPSLSTPNPAYQAPAGRQDGPKKFSLTTLGTAFLNADIIVFQPVNPKDRLVSLVVTATATFDAGTSLTLAMGLHKLDSVHGLGAVIDVDLFCATVNIDTTAIARVDEFTTAASLANIDRGKRIHELAAITTTLTPAEGRGELWAITGRLNVSGAVAAGGSILVEAEIYPG